MFAPGETRKQVLSPVPSSNQTILVRNPTESELEMWLHALKKFFNTRYYPFEDVKSVNIQTRNFGDEAQIVEEVLLRAAQLALSLGETEGRVLASSAQGLNLDAATNDATSVSLNFLAESLKDISGICRALRAAPKISFDAWASIGRLLERELNRSAAMQMLTLSGRRNALAIVKPELRQLAEQLTPATLSADMLLIFSDLARLLERLRFIETLLRRDYPLKQTLLIFTLVHTEAQSLLQFIETRALRSDELDSAVFDVLDGTSYAIGMELRKVFARELVGVSALREAPVIYARIENAHGLLRDCLQQSTVTLAQLYDAQLDGARLFSAFQAKLDQSLALRRDLWTLLHLVRRAEQERGSLTQLCQHLAAFRDGSMRYLMYKDWESCERLMDEVIAAREAELALVLHRFGTYLETLFGQINMRAVLADHPFDHTTVEA